MSQPNPSAELEELIAETREKAIRGTAERCVELCSYNADDPLEPDEYRIGSQECAAAIFEEFLSKK